MIRLSTLGRLEIDGIPNRPAQEILRQPKRFALLVHLALAAGDDRYVRRDALLALFWPLSDERRARRALNQALCFLRARLGHEVLVSRGNDEVGVAGEEVWCDARVFREVVEAGRLEDGLRLYEGDFLPGFHVDDALEFEHWADALRRELRDRAVDAAVALAERAAGAGDVAALRARLREACRLAPYDDAILRRSLTLLAEHGDRRAAAELLAGHRRRLAEDLELEPSDELRELAAALDVPLLDDHDSPPILAGESPAAAGEEPAIEPASAPVLQPARGRPIWRVLRYGLPTAALLLLALALGRSENRLTASPVPGPLAVALGDVASADDELRDLSLALTGVLSTHFAEVDAIRLVRREEVRPGQAPPATLVVEGSLTRVGERLRADFQILDAGTRALLDVVSVDAFAGDGATHQAALETLGREAAARLRERLGAISERIAIEREVPDVAHRRAIDDALLVMAEADSLRARGSHDAADQMLARADAALAAALTEAGESAEIWLLRARIAGKRGWLALRTDPAGDTRFAHWRTGIEHATRAIQVEPEEARALEQRGVLRYWVQNLTSGPADAAASDAIERDLARAVEIDPTLAEAWAVLSVLATRRGAFAEARHHALRAYRADAYLESVSEVLSQLVLTSIEVDDIPGAQGWCDELGRRRPDSWISAKCQLLLLSFMPMPIPKLRGRIDTILDVASSESTWPLVRRQLEAHAALALARAGDEVASRKFFEGIRDLREGDVAWLKAATLAAAGEEAHAASLLRHYIEQDPERHRWVLDRRLFSGLNQRTLERF